MSDVLYLELSYKLQIYECEYEEEFETQPGGVSLCKAGVREYFTKAEVGDVLCLSVKKPKDDEDCYTLKYDWKDMVWRFVDADSEDTSPWGSDADELLDEHFSKSHPVYCWIEAGV